MATLSIMLCCGAGMSSGLLAQQTRKVAKKRGLDVSVEARSESEVPAYYPYISVLLLGPHYATQLDDFTDQLASYNVPVAVIPHEIYGRLDGERLLDFALNLTGAAQA